MDLLPIMIEEGSDVLPPIIERMGIVVAEIALDPILDIFAGDLGEPAGPECLRKYFRLLMLLARRVPGELSCGFQGIHVLQVGIHRLPDRQSAGNRACGLLMGFPARHDILPWRVPDGGLKSLPIGLLGPLGHLDQDALVAGTGQLSRPSVPIPGLLEILALHLAVDSPLNAIGTGPAGSGEAPDAPNLTFIRTQDRVWIAFWIVFGSRIHDPTGNVAIRSDQAFPYENKNPRLMGGDRWWTLLDSNQRPFPCQGNALTN